MRIITGKLKGRVLVSVPDKSVRPATDRVKGTIFNVLQSRLDLRGARVLDLFAGSGSLGFEALSRGAAYVRFVDDQSRSLDIIERNAAALGLLDQCDIIQDDAIAHVQRSNDQFSLIFADPPYAFEGLAEIPGLVMKGRLLMKDGFLIIEHKKQTVIPSSPNYLVAVQKEFGNTRVSFITPTPSA